MRSPTKTGALERLLSAGLEVGAVLDVGVMRETAELKKLFPHLRHYLFEPVEEFFPDIHDNYAGMDYELVAAAASDATGMATLSTKSIFGGGVSHSSLINAGAAPEGAELRQIRTVRLDDFTSELPDNLLLKIDVDGAEMKVLQGAAGLLDKVNCVVVEASRRFLFERVSFLNQQGYEIFDVVDICYYKGFFHQCDVVMLKRRYLDDPRFDGWRQGPFESAAFEQLK